MEQSLFLEYIITHFPALVLRHIERLNDKNQTALTYLHRQLLDKKYSVDGRWSTVIGSYNRVAADVVAMDSSLPLKKRDSLERATGKIPKMGMELWLNEEQMTEIDTLIALKTPINEIIAKILADTPRVIDGILERLELMFLEGLSTGVTVQDDNKNVGTGIRLDYGYLPANQFGVSVLWSDTDNSKVVDDINRVKTKAQREDGNLLMYAYGDWYAFQNLIKSKQFKEQFAFNQGFVGASIPAPTLTQANEVFRSLWGFTFTEVNRPVKLEKNGVQTTTIPWKEGMIVFTSDLKVGALVWASLAEANRKEQVKTATYQIADDYILVSKYHTVKPSFAEWTASQARVCPVITNVDRIYTLDTKTIQA